MLLKRRLPRIDTTRPIEIKPGFESLDPNALAILTWLKEHGVEFILVGPVAEAVHSHSGTALPVAILPAPYRRNLERLARALNAAEARLRNDGDVPDPRPSPAGRITAEHLTRDDVWTLWCGPHPLDVVGTGAPASSGVTGASAYQELLYEANRFELSSELSVEVASPEDIEHYSHLRKTGSPPQMKVTRRTPAGGASAAGPAGRLSPAGAVEPGRSG
jgi:hypothetical protein